MSVKYNVVQRGNPTNPDAPKKFYPSISSSGRVTVRQLARAITKYCTVSTTDTVAVLDGLLNVIPDELSRGNIVELGDFGSFWLRASSEGTESAEAVRSDQINGLLPRFIPGKEFKEVLTRFEFEKAE